MIVKEINIDNNFMDILHKISSNPRIAYPGEMVKYVVTRKAESINEIIEFLNDINLPNIKIISVQELNIQGEIFYKFRYGN